MVWLNYRFQEAVRPIKLFLMAVLLQHKPRMQVLSLAPYNYTVTDAKGCIANGSAILTDPAVILPGTIDIVQDYTLCQCLRQPLQAINYSGGTPGYTFSIDGVNFQASDTFNTGITAGTYTVTVKDLNGCTAQTPAIVIDPLGSAYGPDIQCFGTGMPYCSFRCYGDRR